MVLGAPPFEALTHVVFNVISVVTTTGYASDDYTLWGPMATVAFFYLTFVGGCSGSTAGGMKIFRFQIAMLLLVSQLRFLIHSSGVFVSRYNGQTLTDDITRGVVAFSFFFFLTIAGLVLGLSLMGLDFLTVLSGAATAVANVGPGLGDIIGPSGNFASLPDAAKWLLCLGMLMGRLEILTVLILLIHLTLKEYAVLERLCRHSGRVVTQTQLLREVWGPSHAEDTHYLRIVISKLRQKLGDDPSTQSLLQTEAGIGYRLLIEPERSTLSGSSDLRF